MSFIEEQGFEPSPLTFTAETRAMLKPELILADFGVDDANGDGKISKGESADITLRLQNFGQGKAKQIIVDISENRVENVFIISAKHFELGDIVSGESKDIIFTISTNNRVSEIVNLQVNISEQRPQFSIEDKIILEIEKTQKQLEPIVFKGSDEKENIIFAEDLSIDIEENIPAGSKKNDNILAVVFGIEDYKNVSDVSFAHRDARFIKEYFLQTLGIKENNIYYKANEDVSKAEFDKVFSADGWLDKRVKEGKTEIYFYYAGHGAPDIKQNKAYLIPYDGDPNYASQTGYEMEEIYNNLADLKAKSVTVFLDACFTGANRENEMLLADARPLMIEVKSPIAHGITVFSATGQKEISSAWREKKHGLFSYFLMKGMQGEADVNNDNKLTLKELGDYIQEKVSEQAGHLDREQTPQMISNDDSRILINY
ncbi:MAG: caspase family protein [FCB group bacterium]|nr:caspase family protein [FCB group bacterium]